MPRPTIASAAAELLAEHRALAPEELGRLIAALGRTHAKNPVQAVTAALSLDWRFRRLEDDRWVVPGQLLDGATLTHHLTATEAAAGALAMTPDLAPFMAQAAHGVVLPDGASLRVLWRDEAATATGLETEIALVGPPGWLAGAPGDLLHVRLTGAILRVAPGPKPKADSRLVVRRLAESARMRLAEQEQERSTFFPVPVAVLLDALILDHLADDPGLLAQPLPPLGEAFTAAGLEAHRGFVGLPGTDWEAVDEFFDFDELDDLDDPDDLDDFDLDVEQGDDTLRRGTDADDEASALDRLMLDSFGLEPHEAEGVGIVLGAWELSQRLGGLDNPTTSARLAEILAWPAIARVVAMKAWTDPAFERFVAEIATAARGRDAAGPVFILGAYAEVRDDVADAEQRFRSALEADPRHPLALAAIARYEVDRGDYAVALGRLRTAGVPADDLERAWLERLARPDVRRVGRNEPCPCGSGRKYKACHLDSPGTVGPVDAATALLHKVDRWLAQPDMQHVGAEVLLEVERGTQAIDPVGPATRSRGTRRSTATRTPGRNLEHAIGAPMPDIDPDKPIDPILKDIVLFDRGGLRRFLDVRGSLLPEVERALGRTWLLTRRSLYEVQAVRPGTGVTLRDLRSDDGGVEVPDRSMSRAVGPLDLLCMRLLPDGTGGFLATDAITVPRTQRPHVLDLLGSDDGLDLLRWIMLPAPPLRMTNTEGEPLQLISIAYRVPDPAAASTGLGRKLRDDGHGRFVETIVRHGQEWTRGTVTLEGDRATIDANSQKRAARLERALLRAAPGARLIRREERGIEEALDAERAKGPSADAIDISAHPELAQAMDEFMRRSERSWVDESIPALGGLTPRQAMADRAARPQLEALLDDFEWQDRRAEREPGGTGRGGVGHMDASRIRALLGLPQRTR